MLPYNHLFLCIISVTFIQLSTICCDTANSIKELFGTIKSKNKKIALGSIKSQIGHSFSAAGMANIIKVIEGIRHKQLPPTHRFTRLPEGVSFEGTSLYINTSVKAWETNAPNIPRRAMINAFGFGGINANVLIEEYLPSNVHPKETDDINTDTDIAIVGIGCMDSLASDIESWYKSINTEEHDLQGKNIERQDNIEITVRHMEEMKFPFLKFKIPPTILEQIDRSQQIALVTAGKAIDDYGVDKFKEQSTGVYVGSMLGLESAIKSDLRIRHMEYLDVVNNLSSIENINSKEEIGNIISEQFRDKYPKVEEDTLPGYMDNISAGRIANFYDFDGANEVCDLDFLSFSAALYQAVYSLNSKENSLAVVGGVHANLSSEMIELIYEILKKSGIKDIPIMTEGAVFFVLKPYCEVTSADKVYARIRGVKYGKKENMKNLETVGAESRHLFYFGANEGFRLLENIMLNNQKGSDYKFQQVGNSLFGDGICIEICGSEHTNIEKENMLKTAYFRSENIKTLFDNICTKEELETCEYSYRAAIIYRTEEELNKKIKKGKMLI